MPGKLVERGVVELGGHMIRGVDETNVQAGAPVSVCVRPHRIALGVAPTEPANQLKGRVERAAYLGESRDYLIELTDGTRIRALTPPELKHTPGATVDIYLPIQDCRVVAE
jgi:ABC-type Fe3+/spermidine/putrescine transport system ATPase subunit